MRLKITRYALPAAMNRVCWPEIRLCLDDLDSVSHAASAVHRLHVREPFTRFPYFHCLWSFGFVLGRGGLIEIMALSHRGFIASSTKMSGKALQVGGKLTFE